MAKVREVIQYKNHFENFLLAQPAKVQDKIFKVEATPESLPPLNPLKETFNRSLIFNDRSA